MYGFSVEWPRCLDGAEARVLPPRLPGGFLPVEAEGPPEPAIGYRSGRVSVVHHELLDGVLGGEVRSELPLENPVSLRIPLVGVFGSRPVGEPARVAALGRDDSDVGQAQGGREKGEGGSIGRPERRHPLTTGG